MGPNFTAIFKEMILTVLELSLTTTVAFMRVRLKQIEDMERER
jgi:hypothetical protein